jgi:glycine/D-amino acid oxidase-like deaminating enzyme/nitrite reductase/ring-hydroxylating ferredoxin subunit
MDYDYQHNNKTIKSIWRSFSAGSDFPSQEQSLSVDVAVIGGGITGITTAQLLKESGYKVAVIEALKVGGGSTGHSTGNLYIAVEEGFDRIQSKYDTETLETVVEARGSAMALIENNINRYSIDCDYKKQPWYLFSSNDESEERIGKVLQAARDAGINAEEVDKGELPFKVQRGVKIKNQAQFNPLRYVQQLAKHIASDNCIILENTRVVTIDEEDEDCIRLETDRGNVHAKYVVHATHTPKGNLFDFHSVLGTYREYGIAVKLASGNYPQGIFWGYYNENERFSIRSYTHEGSNFLLAVGQPHRVGQQEDNEENIKNLEKFLAERFDVDEVTNRWGGQNYKPADLLPYIGRKSKGSNIFIATGFSTDGLVWGVVSAMLINDLVNGNETKYTKLFDASRHNVLKAAGNFVKENISNAGEILRDYIFISDTKAGDIPIGEGKVIEVEGKKVAVFHDDSGNVKACSAICTHMGCVVHWNKAEKTWDCPCHASRFDTDGCIIEGPALKPLEQVTVKES